MDDDADGKTEEAVDLAHPLCVTLGEVVIDGDDVDAAPGEGVEVSRESGDEGFAFTRFHLGYFALVENGAADDLDVKVAHADDAFSCLSGDGEGLWHDGVKHGFFCDGEGFGVFLAVQVGDSGGDAGAELGGFLAELVIGEGSDGGLKLIDLGDDGEEALDGAVVGGAEDFGDDRVDHGGIP